MKITLEQYEAALETGYGFCLACGAERECCEPDARNYTCDECGEKQVFGPDELLVMGMIE